MKRNLEAIRTEFAELDFFISENGTTLCGCGCKEATNKNRRFMQGHDRRFIGMMVNAAMADAEVRLVDGGMMITSDAKKAAESLLTERGMAMFNEHLTKAENPAQRKSRAKTATADEAPAEADEPTGPQADDPIRVKIGRWEKDAHVVTVEDGEVTEVRYDSAKGEQFTEKFTVIS